MNTNSESNCYAKFDKHLLQKPVALGKGTKILCTVCLITAAESFRPVCHVPSPIKCSDTTTRISLVPQVHYTHLHFFRFHYYKTSIFIFVLQINTEQ